jgi:hypothetical protein
LAELYQPIGNGWILVLMSLMRLQKAVLVTERAALSIDVIVRFASSGETLSAIAPRLQVSKVPNATMDRTPAMMAILTDAQRRMNKVSNRPKIINMVPDENQTVGIHRQNLFDRRNREIYRFADRVKSPSKTGFKASHENFKIFSNRYIHDINLLLDLLKYSGG